MDSLTNIYNRYGFDELAEEMIAKNPNAHYVVALFDIDDFKFINDIYGHVYGDRALKNLADSMKNLFHRMHYWGETAVTNSVFFSQIAHMMMRKNSYNNSLCFQRYSHTREMTTHFIFLLDMLNTLPLHQTVRSSCAVQMPHFMK